MLGNKLDANNTIILYIKKLTKQLHKTASNNIGFIKKLLLNNFIPTFIIMVLIFSYKSP